MTATDREALKALLITRTALTDIATALGRPEGTVRERINAEGWKLPRRLTGDPKVAMRGPTPPSPEPAEAVEERKPRETGKSWLPHEDEALRAGLAGTSTIDELAETLGRTRAAVKVRCGYLGISYRRPAAPKEKLVDLYRGNDRRRWTKDEVYRLGELWAQPLTPQQIALELRRSFSSVQAHATRLELPHKLTGSGANGRLADPDAVIKIKPCICRCGEYLNVT
jgi:hypothetical protein